ncbi:chorismate mutase [Simkania sp.]|uniref:chorismate mutase n=1 Tax=Simkania sp. TaxID=34094 RepID=UPI003B5267E2
MGIDPKLVELRKQLDHIDEQIIKLFGERRKVIQNVAHFKKESGGEVFDPKREAQIFERVRVIAQDQELDPSAIEQIFRSLITYFREEEARDFGT